jgi:hypothetical protein
MTGDADKLNKSRTLRDKTFGCFLAIVKNEVYKDKN